MPQKCRASSRASDAVRRPLNVQDPIYSRADGVIVFFALALEPGLMCLEIGHAPHDIGSL